jgi:hypothetical protein
MAAGHAKGELKSFGVDNVEDRTSGVVFDPLYFDATQRPNRSLQALLWVIVYPFGSDNVKTAPKFGLALAVMSPRWAAIIRRQMESPRPMPSFFVV